MYTALIIDDESGVRSSLSAVLEDEDYKTFTAPDALAGMDILRKERVDVVFLDVLLPKMGGIEALQKIRAGWPAAQVIVISGHANIDTAVQAVKLGAFDFLEKPLSLEKILTVCRNALTVKRLSEENAALKEGGSGGTEIIGESVAINRVKTLIAKAAPSDANVLITGENGSGKELAAREIHRLSKRAGKPFVAVNCAAIPDTLIESELFGHEKGAFTGADAARKGRFEMASGGTLFLDEIGDMSLAAQSKVLRVIQEGTITRLGSEKAAKVDVRLIAATNKNLDEERLAGRFRNDLFFRLNVLPIRVPSLRERPEDVPLLLRRFLDAAGASTVELAPDALVCMQTYSWPGNVRELRNLAERIAVLWDAPVLDRAGMERLMRTSGDAAKVAPAQDSGLDSFLDMDYNKAKKAFEKAYFSRALDQANGVVARAAEQIGVYPSNLYVKLKKLGLLK
jgi:two-component system nitrogen regulation response regulator NtrX